MTKKNMNTIKPGFTMVELIFVIVIIGVLASVALPKFNGVKDKAKINAEIASMSGLNGAIVAAVEFQIDDFGNNDVNWHSRSSTDTNGTSQKRKEAYEKINKSKSVLKNVAKKAQNIQIIGFLGYKTGFSDKGILDYKNDVLLLVNVASSRKNGGVKVIKDVLEKPDSNDFWIFNPNNMEITVTAKGATTLHETSVTASGQSITLIDVSSQTMNISDIQLSTSNGTAVAVMTVN